MEGSNFFDEAKKGVGKAEVFPPEEEKPSDMADYAFPPEIEITRLQHEIEGIDKDLESLKEKNTELEARAKTASDRLTGVNLNGKDSLIAIARAFTQAIEAEKSQLTAEQKKLEETKSLLQGNLDKAFKKLPPKTNESFM